MARTLAIDVLLRRLEAVRLEAVRLEAVRLEGGRAGVGGAMHLASDADGTIWRGDVGFELFERAIARRLLRPEAHERLLGEARTYGVSEAGDANDLAGALWEAHGRGRYPSPVAFAMHAWCFAGYGRGELTALCRELMDDYGIEARLRPELARIREWAVDHDLPFWLVSASPRVAVDDAVERLGWPAGAVIAMEPAWKDGVVLPDVAGVPTYSEGKLVRLRQRAEGTLLASFGDSVFDLALLEAARIGVAVAPSAALVARVAELESACILEAP